MSQTGHKTWQMRCLELEHGCSIETLIRSRVEQGWTEEQIAAFLGITRPTLCRWNKLLGRQTVRTKSVRFASEAASNP